MWQVTKHVAGRQAESEVPLLRDRARPTHLDGVVVALLDGHLLAMLVVAVAVALLLVVGLALGLVLGVVHSLVVRLALDD